MTGRPFTQRMGKLKTEDVALTFSADVRETFRKLYEVMKERPNFDPETLALIHDMIEPTPHFVPVALAALTRIAAETAAQAQSNDNPVAKKLLKQLSAKLYGGEDASQSVTVVTVPEAKITSAIVAATR